MSEGEFKMAIYNFTQKHYDEIKADLIHDREEIEEITDRDIAECFNDNIVCSEQETTENIEHFKSKSNCPCSTCNYYRNFVCGMNCLGNIRIICAG